MAKKRAKMGEIWPVKKSAGRRSIIEGSVHGCVVDDPDQLGGDDDHDARGGHDGALHQEPRGLSITIKVPD